MKAVFRHILPVGLALCLLSGCGSTAGKTETEAAFVDEAPLGVASLEEETVALAEGPAALDTVLQPEATGVLTKENEKAVIDYSNTEDGYVMVCYTAETNKRLKAR